MKLYLVQHGHAVDKETNLERPLSPQGIQDVEAMGQFLMSLHLDIPAVWHSGKLRAQETAERLARYVARGVKIEERPDLAPNDPVKQAASQIEKRDNDVMVVGHLPHLSRLAAWFLCGTDKRDVLTFQQGGVACLKRSPEGDWSVCWMVVPALLQKGK